MAVDTGADLVGSERDVLVRYLNKMRDAELLKGAQLCNEASSLS